MPYCECGAFVTRDWKRVYGDNDGNVVGCQSCMSNINTADDIAKVIRDE